MNVIESSISTNSSNFVINLKDIESANVTESGFTNRNTLSEMTSWVTTDVASVDSVNNPEKKNPILSATNNSSSIT